MYKENPKTKGSGIVCCIPQTSRCPMNCEDCFFQSGRSFLEPLEDNLPNMPEDVEFRVVRVNDGNDSNVDRPLVMKMTKDYPMRFYNTSIPLISNLEEPTVLTINPGRMTDNDFFKLDPIPKNLMFVRFRTNTWNITQLIEAVEYYTSRKVPIVLTFMAYFDTADKIPENHRMNYMFRKRTLNSYWAITTEAWRGIMSIFQDYSYVYSCGKIEGEKGTTKCERCGNCIREYFVTKERMRNG